MWTEYPISGVAIAVPLLTIRLIFSSSAICHCIGTLAAGILPSSLNGLGANRVHSTTLFGNGSPEATPKLNR